MISRAIANNGLPLKIQTQWTDNDYYERVDPELDDLKVVNVAGFLVRINGKKYPRGHTDGDGEPDWTYRYTGVKNDEEGRQVVIKRALDEARLTVW